MDEQRESFLGVVGEQVDVVKLVYAPILILIGLSSVLGATAGRRVVTG